MAFDAFLLIEDIPGESTDDAHAEWIEVLSFNHGISQPTSASASSGGGASAERCDHGDFNIVKAIDLATVPIHMACCKGTHIPKVTLELCRAGGEKVKYMSVILSQVVISNVRPGGSSGGSETLPLEEVSFNYGKIEWEYNQQSRADGTGGGAAAGGWDLTLNAEV